MFLVLLALYFFLVSIFIVSLDHLLETEPLERKGLLTDRYGYAKCVFDSGRAWDWYMYHAMAHGINLLDLTLSVNPLLPIQRVIVPMF